MSVCGKRLEPRLHRPAPWSAACCAFTNERFAWNTACQPFLQLCSSALAGHMHRVFIGASVRECRCLRDEQRTCAASAPGPARSTPAAGCSRQVSTVCVVPWRGAAGTQHGRNGGANSVPTTPGRLCSGRGSARTLRPPKHTTHGRGPTPRDRLATGPLWPALPAAGQTAAVHGGRGGPVATRAVCVSGFTLRDAAPVIRGTAKRAWA